MNETRLERRGLVPYWKGRAEGGRTTLEELP